MSARPGRKTRQEYTRITLEVRRGPDGRHCAEVVGLKYSAIGGHSPIDAACRIASIAAQVFREELDE